MPARRLVLASAALALLAAPGLAGAEQPPPTLCTLEQAADGHRPNAAQHVALGTELGVDCERDAVSTLAWTGSDPVADAITAAGFKLNLNLRNLPPQPGTTAPPSVPPRTPEELRTFRATVTSILGRYQPALLTVENEENAPKFFSGTPQEYIRELRATIHVARPLGIPVTNGGITSVPLALMTWQRLLHRKGREAADDYATRVFSQSQGRAGWQKILADLLVRPYQGVGDVPGLQESWDFAKQIVHSVRRKRHGSWGDHSHAAPDFVNFHWYFVDPRALSQSVDYLRRATRRPLVMTEIGQYDREPLTVQNLLRRAFAVGLRYVVWFDGDGDPAQALHNGDGTLRPNGEEFRAFAGANPHG